MGTDPNSPDNRLLRDAMQKQIPIIYFLATSPGRYQPIIPTFIAGWHPERLRVDLAFGAIVGASAQATLPASPERRYALREIKARFAPSIVSRCRPERLKRSLCDLPSARAAAARCRSHHHRCGRAIRTAGDLEWPAADQNFDAHLIGVDPDYRIHVSDRLLEIHDGPFLELGLKGIAGTSIKLPRRSDDRPDRDRLARRFEEFKKAA
jgi:putative restriction endonuclease